MSTICDTDQCSWRHISARTYIGELLIAFVIIIGDSEHFSHDLKVCQHITPEGFQGRSHRQQFRLVGELNVGLVHVSRSRVFHELTVVDAWYAPGLVQEGCDPLDRF